MTIKFTWSIKDSNGVRATGKSPTITIQRDSDNYYWNGSAFQLAEISNAMTEQGKGVYYFDYTSTLQDLYVFFDESTIPRYSEAFFSLSDLIDQLDGLNMKIDTIAYDSTTGRVTTCVFKFSATSDFSSPVFTVNVTYEYNTDGTIKTFTRVMA